MIATNNYAKNKLVLSPSHEHDWELLQDFTETTKYGEITVPKGYITDLASSPRFTWSFVPPFGRYSQAAVIHDWLCSNPSNPNYVNRHKVFYELMLKYKTKPFKANVMYYAVKVYGWYWDCKYKLGNYKNKGDK